MRWWCREDGTVLTLALGGVLLVLVVVLTLADASSLFMRRMALGTVADNAAIAAANAVDVEALYERGIGSTLALDPLTAAQLARASIAQASDPQLADVRLDDVRVDGDGVTVVVSAAVPTPLGPITGDRDVRIRASASAILPTRL